jgi:hypothetical protein
MLLLSEGFVDYLDNWTSPTTLVKNRCKAYLGMDDFRAPEWEYVELPASNQTSINRRSIG